LADQDIGVDHSPKASFWSHLRLLVRKDSGKDLVGQAICFSLPAKFITGVQKLLDLPLVILPTLFVREIRRKPLLLQHGSAEVR
jgi:hypothetical protein